MNKDKIKRLLLNLNATRKFAKPIAICISLLFVISMITVFASTGAITNSIAATNITPQTTATGLHTDGKYIKDSSGNIVYLRGLQKVEMADDPDGSWMGNIYWSDENVRTELREMKSWGANTVRCIQAIENWKYDLSTPYAAISNREAVKRLATIAQEEGMYVVFTAYRVTNYFNGGNQDPLPYPPYQTSSGASAVIGSKQDFVNYWTSVATVLKDYPNVIFEIWNEPNSPDGNAMIEFFGVQQQVINAIRATGAQNIIMPQWDFGSWVNLDYISSGGSTMDWINTAQLSDPSNNLVYVTHIYREYGDTGIYSSSSSISNWGTNHAYDYNEIIRAFQGEKLDWVLNTLNKPLFVTETGYNVDQGGAEATYENIAFNNTLKIFNEWGINYIVHWWREIGIFRLHSGPPDFTPTAGGTITKYYLQNQPATPTTSNPTQTPLLNSSNNDSSTQSLTKMPASTLAVLTPMSIATIMMSAVLLVLLAVLPSLVTTLRSKGRIQ